MRTHGVWTLCALIAAGLIASLPGCQPARVPRNLSTFDAAIVPGILTHDIVLTNQNLRSLKQVELTVTVYFETKVETCTRHWAYWEQDKSQTVNVASSGRIQRVVIEGTALAGEEEEPVRLTSDWLLKYE